MPTRKECLAMMVPVLRNICKTKGVKGYWRMKKIDLVDKCCVSAVPPEPKKTIAKFDAVVSDICPPPYNYEGYVSDRKFDVAEEGRKYFARQYYEHRKEYYKMNKDYSKYLDGSLWCEKNGKRITLMEFEAHRDKGIKSLHFYNDDVKRWRNGEKTDDIELSEWEINVLKDLKWMPGDRHGLYLGGYENRDIFDRLKNKGYVTTKYVESEEREWYPSHTYTVGVMTEDGKEVWKKIMKWEQIPESLGSWKRR